MKKIISIAIALVLVLALCVPALAADPTLTAKFDKDPGSVKVGDTVTVKLGIENNPGVLIMGGILEYDESVLKVTDGDIANGDIFSIFLHGNAGSGMKLNWLGDIMAGDIDKNGDIATVTFTVVGKDPDGSTEVKFLFDEENGAFNFNEESITWKDSAALSVSIEKGENAGQSNSGDVTEVTPGQNEGTGNTENSGEGTGGSTENVQPDAENPGEADQPGENSENDPEAEGSIEVSGRPGGKKDSSSGGIWIVVAAVVIGAGIVTGAVIYTKKKQ